MKRLKSFIGGILIGSICTLTVSGIAAGVWDKIDVLKNDIKVVVNGKEIIADNFLYNDTTYLPMRAIGEALGENVQYDETTNTAYIGERTEIATSDTNIQSKYPLIGDLNDPEVFHIYMKVIDGEYYLCDRALETLFNLKCFADDHDIIFQLNDNIEKKIPYIRTDDNLLIPYDDFMEQVYPYIN